MVGDESPQDNRKNNSLTVSETSKKVEAFQSFVNGSVSSIDDAARWLVLNRSAVVGPVIPFLKEKFGLSNPEAIEVTKAAHVLQYGKVQ
ncbi:hypothetical protein [Rhizobium rhizogenes]|jgi:hypothetical protein|uniref:hypothetical protein n=1 Tax=Rhizobium rhizogenes TaxID=359 RepID=UPI00157369B7|nr:hypothetical protein [Rhizobium rhizogenes]NTG06879.1 hypothetical protein [Rhizobium rhizogenes]